MSSSALRGLAGRIDAAITPIINRTSKQSRGFLNFNPTFYSLSDDAIRTGILLDDPNLAQIIENYNALNRNNAEITEEIIKFYNAQRNTDTRYITDTLVKIVAHIYRVQVAKGADFTISEAKLNIALNAVNEEIARDTNDIPESRNFASDEPSAEYLAAINANKPEREKARALESKYKISERAKSAELTKNKITLQILEKIGYAGKTSGSVLLNISDAGPEESIGVLILSLSAYGREDANGFKRLRGIVGKAAKEVDQFFQQIERAKQVKGSLEADVIKVLTTSNKLQKFTPEEISSLGDIRSRDLADIRTIVTSVNVGHVADSVNYVKGLAQAAKEIENIAASVNDASVADETSKIVSTLNGFITEYTTLHKAFSDTIYRVDVNSSKVVNTNNLRFGGALQVIVTMGQNAVFNQTIFGSGLEDQIYKAADAYLKDIGNISGSSTFLTLLADSIIAKLKGKQFVYSHISKARGRERKAKDGKKVTNYISVANRKIKPSSKKVISRVMPPEEVRQRRESHLNLIALIESINLDLYEAMKRNMVSPNLVFRTGRLARSAKVLTATRLKDGSITFRYTYALDPYSTFEPGGAQGSMQRDPRKLVAKSIRDVAAKKVAERFRSIKA